MTEKLTKRNDAEIENALKCCTDYNCGNRTDCPYFGITSPICLTQLAIDALDYINHLKSIIADLYKDIDCLRESDKKNRKETAKEILEHFMTLPTCKHPTIATGNFTFGKDYIRKLAKKYGVEVDE